MCRAVLSLCTEASKRMWRVNVEECMSHPSCLLLLFTGLLVILEGPWAHELGSSQTYKFLLTLFFCGGGSGWECEFFFIFMAAAVTISWLSRWWASGNLNGSNLNGWYSPSHCLECLWERKAFDCGLRPCLATSKDYCQTRFFNLMSRAWLIWQTEFVGFQNHPLAMKRFIRN